MNVAGRYDRLARRYDRRTTLLHLLGFRFAEYHRLAVQELDPRPGQKILVLGCGTGIDFAAIERGIGPTGRILAVDLSEGMLDEARQRIARNGWSNIGLVQADLGTYKIPKGFDHVLASFVLKLTPRYREIIQVCHDHLPTGGRFAMADFQIPRSLRRVVMPLLAPFGHTLEGLARRPDEAAQKVFPDARILHHYAGMAYVLVGTKA